MLNHYLSNSDNRAGDRLVREIENMHKNRNLLQIFSLKWVLFNRFLLKVHKVNTIRVHYLNINEKKPRLFKSFN